MRRLVMLLEREVNAETATYYKVDWRDEMYSLKREDLGKQKP